MNVRVFAVGLGMILFGCPPMVPPPEPAPIPVAKQPAAEEQAPTAEAEKRRVEDERK